MNLVNYISIFPSNRSQFWKYFSNKSVFRKIIEGYMLNRSQTTTFLQISYDLLLYSQVILKRMRVADDTLEGISECEWVMYQ